MPAKDYSKASAAEYRQLHAEMQQMKQTLNAIVYDTGMQHAIGAATKELGEIFAPLRAFAPVRKLDKCQEKKIGQLRASLARADFSDVEHSSSEALPNPDRGYKKGAAA